MRDLVEDEDGQTVFEQDDFVCHRMKTEAMLWKKAEHIYNAIFQWYEIQIATLKKENQRLRDEIEKLKG